MQMMIYSMMPKVLMTLTSSLLRVIIIWVSEIGGYFMGSSACSFVPDKHFVLLVKKAGKIRAHKRTWGR